MQKGKNSVNEQVQEFLISSTMYFLGKLRRLFVMLPRMISNIPINLE